MGDWENSPLGALVGALLGLALAVLIFGSWYQYAWAWEDRVNRQIMEESWKTQGLNKPPSLAR